MIFLETSLPGVYQIHPEEKHDERGFFARTWCEQEFREHGLSSRIAQCSISFNRKKGTLRGLHYQADPHAEEKLVRCTQGAIFDVAVDLRPASPTYKQWFGMELTAGNRRMLFIPKGCAHGFVTLEDSSEIFYQISEFYAPGSARGVRWDDSAFQIRWPMDPEVISDRDRDYPDFEPNLNTA
jgi:dTDP-4-dehydrorhamnose 3,5-epimerase